MAITKTFFDFLKTKVNPFLKTNPHISKETLTDFISKVSDDIVYAHIVTKYNTEVITRKELVATLVENGIDKRGQSVLLRSPPRLLRHRQEVLGHRLLANQKS